MLLQHVILPTPYGDESRDSYVLKIQKTDITHKFHSVLLGEHRFLMSSSRHVCHLFSN